MKTSKPTRTLAAWLPLSLMLSSASFLHTTAFSEAMPVCSADEGSGDNGQLFKSNGKTYNVADLATAQKQAVYEADMARYEAVKTTVDNYLLENYMTEEAKNSKKTVETVEKTLFQTATPTEKETREFYDKNKERIPLEYDKVKSRIVDLLKHEAAVKKRDALLERIKTQYKFALLLKAPSAPIADVNATGFPTKGNPSAKVKIVEFADYQCPHCKVASQMVKEVVERYKDKVQFTYMDFPLHGNEGPSFDNAVAAYCAEQQNKFWEFHYMVFSADHLDKDSPLTFAKNLGLDQTKFKACLATDAARNRVKHSRNEGERLGVNGTPSIYVNGRKINGYSQETLAEEIEKALAAAK